MIQASVAVYPLQQADYQAVHSAIKALSSTAVKVDVRDMHTIINGSPEAVFQALQRAYETAAASGPTVMTVTVSNACPVQSQS